jgi:integral membrane protein (TIGR00529 family)
MYPLIVIAGSLILLVVLLRIRIRIGRAMIATAIAAAAFLGATPADMGRALVEEWQHLPLGQNTLWLFVTLAALLVLVNVLGQAMQEVELAERLAPALRTLFKSRRMALAGIPMLMGLLPTPGGIMLSAPLIKAPGEKIGVDSARLGAINYFFRHLWETVWPMYPAIPLVQGMLGVSASRLLAHNVFLLAAGLISGTVFLLLTGIPPRSVGPEDPQPTVGNSLRIFLQALWPIALAALLYAAAGFPPAVGLLPAIVLFFICHRIPLPRWAVIFRQGFEPDHVLLIFGALLFKLSLTAAMVIPQIVGFLTGLHVPTMGLVFILPFLVAFLTGLSLPAVATTFPLLLGFFGTGLEANIGLQTLAYGGVICGWLTSPIHLCMALTISYFQTSYEKILLTILWPTLSILAVGFLIAAFS